VQHLAKITHWQKAHWELEENQVPWDYKINQIIILRCILSNKSKWGTNLKGLKLKGPNYAKDSSQYHKTAMLTYIMKQKSIKHGMETQTKITILKVSNSY